MVSSVDEAIPALILWSFVFVFLLFSRQRPLEGLNHAGLVLLGAAVLYRQQSTEGRDGENQIPSALEVVESC